MTLPVTRDDAHNYYAGSDLGPYPSVTTVVGMLDKPLLRGWVRRHAIEQVLGNLDGFDNEDVDAFEAHVTRAALKKAELGNRVHKAIERYVKALLVERAKYPDSKVTPVFGQLGDDLRYQFGEFQKFERLKRVEWLESELLLVSPRLGVGGTADALAVVPDRNNERKRTLVDFKTGSRTWVEHVLQLAGYTAMIEETRPDLMPEAWGILHLADGEPYDWHPVTITALDIATFRLLIDVYGYMKNRQV
jgi:hypothetical protein